MACQENLRGYLAGIHLGDEAKYTCVLGTLNMSVASNPSLFPLLLTLHKDKVFGPSQILALLSYSNLFLTDFSFSA